ncbi:hypothetical protein ABH917_004646 [Thermobifida halotolerans]
MGGGVVRRWGSSTRSGAAAVPRGPGGWGVAGGLRGRWRRVGPEERRRGVGGPGPRGEGGLRAAAVARGRGGAGVWCRARVAAGPTAAAADARPIRGDRAGRGVRGGGVALGGVGGGVVRRWGSSTRSGAAAVPRGPGGRGVAGGLRGRWRRVGPEERRRGAGGPGPRGEGGLRAAAVARGRGGAGVWCRARVAAGLTAAAADARPTEADPAETGGPTGGRLRPGRGRGGKRGALTAEPARSRPGPGSRAREDTTDRRGHGRRWARSDAVRWETPDAVLGRGTGPEAARPHRVLRHEFRILACTGSVAKPRTGLGGRNGPVGASHVQADTPPGGREVGER